MINIVYFSKYREQLGCSREQYGIEVTKDLNALREAIACRHGDRSVLMLSDPRCVVAINQQVVTGNPVLHAGNEVAFFPPVTGG